MFVAPADGHLQWRMTLSQRRLFGDHKPAVEPQAGRRCVLVTERRAKPDFVRFTRHLLEHVYRSARRVHLVMDNLNTHFRSCFEEVLGVNAARRLLRRVEFHYTPKHASWLNMAESEIGVLTRQCLDRRMPDLRTVSREVSAWQKHRNDTSHSDMFVSRFHPDNVTCCDAASKRHFLQRMYGEANSDTCGTGA
jgi:hypothetical protein